MGDNKSNQPEFITGLIDMYRMHPCLWQIKSKNYSNRVLREKAYASLLQYYKGVDENATLDTLKNKLNNLRSSFRKELKKVNKCKKSGSGSEEVYVPKLWYFKLLSFTSDQETPLRPVSNDSDEEQDTEGDISGNEIEQNSEEIRSPISTVANNEFDAKNIAITPVTSPQPSNISVSSSRCPSRTSTTSTTRSAPKRQVADQRELIEKVCSTLVRNEKTDEFHAIGENVAYKFRRMNEELRLYAEQLLHKVLFYAVQNKLTPDSDVVVSKPVTNQRSFNYEVNQIPVSHGPHYYKQHLHGSQYQHPYQFPQVHLPSTSSTPSLYSTVASPDTHHKAFAATSVRNENASPEQLDQELSELITLHSK